MMDCASTQRLISFARYSQFLHSQVKCRAFYSSLVTLPTLLIARVVNSELPRLRTTAISFTTVARLEVTEPRARLLKHSPTRQLACAEGSSLQCETVDSLTQTEGRTSKFSPTAKRTRSILQWNLQREPDGRTELVSMYHPTATRYSLFDGTPEGRKGQTLYLFGQP